MKRLILPLIMVGTLTACGGGGSSSTATSEPMEIDVVSLWKNFLTTERTMMVSGAGSDGAAYEIKTTIRPRNPQLFAQHPSVDVATYSNVEITHDVKRNGTNLQTAQSLLYFRPIESRVISILNPAEATCVVPDDDALNPSIPNMAGVNTSGPLFNGSEYEFNFDGKRCSRQGVVGAPLHSITWSHEMDMDTPLFCVKYSQVALGDNQLQTICLELAGNDSLTGSARVSITANDLAVVAKNY